MTKLITSKIHKQIETAEASILDLSESLTKLLIEALNEEACRVEIDGFNAKIQLGKLRFCLWIANGIDSFKPYENGNNTVELRLVEGTREELWKALAPYMEKHRHQAFVFEPKKPGEPEDMPF